MRSCMYEDHSFASSLLFFCASLRLSLVDVALFSPFSFFRMGCHPTRGLPAKGKKEDWKCAVYNNDKMCFGPMMKIHL